MDRADLTVEMAMDRVGTDMRQSRGAKFQCAVAAICLLLVALLAGCSRDPNVRKHKYLESGQRYFDKEQYREAAIQFENAIQVDQHFTDAHYKLALTALKLEQWPSAYFSFRVRPFSRSHSPGASRVGPKNRQGPYDRINPYTRNKATQSDSSPRRGWPKQCLHPNCQRASGRSPQTGKHTLEIILQIPPSNRVFALEWRVGGGW